MLDYFKKWFNKSGEDEIHNNSNPENIGFVLFIDDMVVGFLDLKNNEWQFYYSEEFKSQDVYHRLVGFRDVNKKYTSDVLWPFFKLRIPGLGQPMIREIIERENINPESELELLVRFGERASANPYILKVVYYNDEDE